LDQAGYKAPSISVATLLEVPKKKKKLKSEDGKSAQLKSLFGK